MMDGQGDVNRTSSLGWIYVVVSDTRSPGPRQPVPSWLPGSAIAVYGSLLIVVGVLLNATVLGSSLVAGKKSTISAVRRLLTANTAAIQLGAAFFVVPPGVVTEAVGGWTFGGHACRAWLLGQVLVIAGMMWSIVGLDVDCVVRLAAPRRAYAVLSERRPRTVALVIIASSWVVAGLATLPIGLAVGTRQAGADSDSAPVLEDVCAVSLSRSNVIAQSLAAFHVPGALGLSGSAAIMATKTFKTIEVDCRGRGNWSGSMAVAAVGAASVLLWLAFFVLYTLLPFCGDALCIDPATWTLFAWVGHSTVVVAPAAWFIDPAVRSDVRQLGRAVRRLFRRCFGRGFPSNATSSASDGVGNVDESSCLMSVTKYQIQRPSKQEQQSHTDSPSVCKSSV